jgi:hypothetical protein
MGINTYIFFYNFVIYIIFCVNRSIVCCSLVVVLHAFYMEGAGSTPIYHHLAISTTIFVKMWDLNFYFASINFFYQHGPPKNLLLAPPLIVYGLNFPLLVYYNFCSVTLVLLNCHNHIYSYNYEWQWSYIDHYPRTYVKFALIIYFKWTWSTNVE